MIEIVNEKQVKVFPANESGCDLCCFEKVCNRHSNRYQHKDKPKLYLDCMAKYRLDNRSVYFLDSKRV